IVHTIMDAMYLSFSPQAADGIRDRNVTGVQTCAHPIWFEMDLPLQIYVPCRKEALIKIGIHRTDGHIQFRVVCQDMIRGLSLFDQRGNDLILFVKLPLGHVDRKSTRLNSSHVSISYAVFCLNKKKSI